MKIGSITIIKNVCFRDGKVDHSYRKGRPCIFLGELEDKMYFMPLTNITTLKRPVRPIITPNETNCLIKASHPNIRELLEKPIAYYVETGCITEDEIITLFKTIKNFYKETRTPKEEKILALANNYLNQTSLNYVDEDILKNKVKEI